MPIPVPDVPGADAGSAGLPDRSDLTALQRLVVDSSALADLGLRTAISTVVGAAVAPTILTTALRRSEARRERENIAFYVDLAAHRDPASCFPAPTAVPEVSSRAANPIAEYIAQGHVHNGSFASSFEPANPAMRDRWNQWKRNNIVRFQHWRHDDGPRPTLCVIHGFMGSPYLVNGLFFSLPWFYRSGYDVLLYTLPFHGRRAENLSPFSGYGFFANGMSGFAEAMGQAVYDFRTILNWLRHNGVDRIALTGLSLGGYTSALVASADDRLEAVIPNVPLVTPPVGVRRLVAGEQGGAIDPGRRRNEPRGGLLELCLPLAAELPSAGPEGPPPDHHRSRRPARPARPCRGAVGTLGPLCAALVSGKPHPARQPAGVPAAH